MNIRKKPEKTEHKSNGFEMKSLVVPVQIKKAQKKFLPVIQKTVSGFLEAKELAALEEVCFVTQHYDNSYWMNLVLKDITEEPKRKDQENYKQFYARAYLLWLKIRNAIQNPATSKQEQRALFIEAFKNGYEMYAARIIKYVDVNQEIEEKEYPGIGYNPTFMHECAYMGNAKMMKLLLNNKAKVDPVGWGGCGTGELFAMCEGMGNTPLILAAVHGKDNCVALLLDAKANVNYQTMSSGETALHAAAQNNRTNCVKLLLAANADLRIKDDQGRMPLDLSKEDSECEALIQNAMKARGLTVPARERQQCSIQ